MAWTDKAIDPLLVGIAGGTGSGKSELTKMLVEHHGGAGVLVLDQDSYYRDRSYLSEDDRNSLNYDEPGAVDHELLHDHLLRLRAGQPVVKPRYCFLTHTREPEGEVVRARPLVFVEGLFVLWNFSIRAVLDLKVFVEADSDIRFIRRLRRDVFERGRTVESVVTQYLTTVRPMHEVYIQPTKQHADLVVNNNASLDDPFKQMSQAVTFRLSARADEGGDTR